MWEQCGRTGQYGSNDGSGKLWKRKQANHRQNGRLPTWENENMKILSQCWSERGVNSLGVMVGVLKRWEFVERSVACEGGSYVGVGL